MSDQSIKHNRESSQFLPQPSPSGAKRLLSLDILRGIAILLVLGNHAPLWNQAGLFQPFASCWHRTG